jgi:hypothetical protein
MRASSGPVSARVRPRMSLSMRCARSSGLSSYASVASACAEALSRGCRRQHQDRPRPEKPSPDAYHSSGETRWPVPYVALGGTQVSDLRLMTTSHVSVGEIHSASNPALIRSNTCSGSPPLLRVSVRDMTCQVSEQKAPGRWVVPYIRPQYELLRLSAEPDA